MSINSLSSDLGRQVSAGLFTADGSSADSAGAASAGGPSFGDALQKAFDSVNDLQTNAAQSARQFALGQVNDIHSVMIAGQKASVALELTTEVRNKIVDAYQTIMSIQM